MNTQRNLKTHFNKIWLKANEKIIDSRKNMKTINTNKVRENMKSFEKRRADNKIPRAKDKFQLSNMHRKNIYET